MDFLLACFCMQADAATTTVPPTSIPSHPRTLTLDSICGHAEICVYLKRALQESLLPHALLFHGPSGVGKRSAAFALAKELVPPAGANAALRADVARRISDGIHPDVLYVEPSGPTNSITLAGWKPERESADGPQHYRFVESSPMEGGRRVLILRDADRMNIALANYLLKLIEEPPSYLSIILTSRRRGEVLTTIRSRCAPLKFSPLPQDDMERLAGGWFTDANSSERRAQLRLAGGRPGVLKELLSGDPEVRRRQVVAALNDFSRLGFLRLFRSAADLAGGKGNASSGLELVCDDLLAFFRDALILKTLPDSPSERLVFQAQRDQVQQFTESCTDRGLENAVSELQRFRPLASRPMDRALLMESLLMKIGPALKS